MNLSDYKEEKPHKAKRLLWMVINATIFRISIGRPLRPFRNWLLKLFGAKVSNHSYIYASCKIFMPWNLECGRACVGPNTNLYNKAKITIGDDTVISQGSFLCTASHDISSMMLPLTMAPITLGNKVWIAADCFVGPGVTLHDGSVLGARGCLFKDAEELGVYGGNPANFIKRRDLND